MSSAMERLAAELAKLSADEWAQLPEPQIAGQAADAEIAERPGEIGRDAVTTISADGALVDAFPQATIGSGNQR